MDLKGLSRVSLYVSDDKAKFIFTDSGSSWGDMTDWDTKHRKVNHTTEEWVRGIVHTNTIEGVWSLFKRSVGRPTTSYQRSICRPT